MEEKSQSNAASTEPQALDGGWGWMVVLGAFLAYFIADGWAYSFGVFFPVFVDSLQEGEGKTSLIGALVYGVPLIVSPVVCALTNIYGCRCVIICSGLLCSLSFILSSFATSVDFLCVTLGVMASIGLAGVYIPSIVIVTYYFDKRRGFATGLAVTGSGLGAFAFPPAIKLLMDQFGWQGALLILGAVFLHVCAIGGMFRPLPPKTGTSVAQDAPKQTSSYSGRHLKLTTGNILMPRLHQKSQNNLTRSCSVDRLPSMARNRSHQSTLSLHSVSAEELACSDDNRCKLLPGTPSCPDVYQETTVALDPMQPASKRKYCVNFRDELRLVVLTMMDKSLLQSWGYLTYCGAGFILFLWIGVPYIFLVDAATLLGINENKAVFLLSIIGIGRTIGQPVLGYLGDLKQVNVVLLYAGAVIVSGVGTVLVPFCSTYTALVVYSAVFGFFVSVTYSLQMICLVEIVGLARVTSAFGLFQLLQGIATVLGTPVAGWLYQAVGHYDPSFYTTGGLIVLSGLLLLPVFCMRKTQGTVEQEDSDLA